MTSPVRLAAGLALAAALTSISSAAEPVRPASERFAGADVTEVPDFQRHVLPLFGRLECNGRACHGSFQGQGGFRLSLFGYDFDADHKALLEDGSGRVDREVPELSKILAKPTLSIPHKGGKRIEPESWPYHLLYRWIEEGATGKPEPLVLDRLDVTPSEIVFQSDSETVSLRVIAHWSDGSQEDVTCLSRFRSNDESIATIDAEGKVTTTGKGDTHVITFYDNGVAATPVLRPVSDRTGPNYPELPTPARVDELVVAKLRTLGIIPSEVCTDAEFLRRASLDITGTLPTPEEVSVFLADSNPEKRARKIDELLERPTYAAWWSNRLCDITGNNPRDLRRLPVAPDLARDWYRWIERRVRDNTPYDDLVAGIVLGTSRSPGQSYEDYIEEQSRYYRKDDPVDFADRETMPYFWAQIDMRKTEEKALTFSYAFLGVRLECAQCHKHPFDRWTQQDFNEFAAFLAPIASGVAPDARDRNRELLKELAVEGKNANQRRKALEDHLREGETVPWDEVFLRKAPARRNAKAKKRPNDAGRVVTAKLLGDERVSLAEVDDPRKPLMDWMRSPDNPYFARVFVNRVWADYYGRGIVNPPDDINLANPPSNRALLDELTEGFVSHDFDMKWLHRTITNSLTYQRSWQTNSTNELDDRNFSHAAVRRLPAEVLLDAISQATADRESLPKLAREVENRSFGPSASARFGQGRGNFGERVFGRSTRDANCDCSRSDEPNLLQSIYLQNDQDILKALQRKDGWVAELTSASRNKKGREARSDVESIAREAYLRALGREPDESELATVRSFFEQAPKPADALRDLLWALLNTKEFVTNH